MEKDWLPDISMEFSMDCSWPPMLMLIDESTTWSTSPESWNECA